MVVSRIVYVRLTEVYHHRAPVHKLGLEHLLQIRL